MCGMRLLSIEMGCGWLRSRPDVGDGAFEIGDLPIQQLRGVPANVSHERRKDNDWQYIVWHSSDEQIINMYN
jgi:hypothetical protein